MPKVPLLKHFTLLPLNSSPPQKAFHAEIITLINFMQAGAVYHQPQLNFGTAAGM